jgi:hypothetical protein
VNGVGKMSERELKFDLLKPDKPLRWIFDLDDENGEDEEDDDE